MTWQAIQHYAVYAAEWAALILAWRQFNRVRPGKHLPSGYVMIVALLMVLQLYGEAWRH
ncbi:MAG TPA: hypothetical protein V6D05_14025 [Stenomitos sp.]